MKNAFFAVARIGVMGLLMYSMVSCDKDGRLDPSENISDVAVSGLVEDFGMTFAVINGYVNLNLLHLNAIHLHPQILYIQPLLMNFLLFYPLLMVQ